MEAKLQAAAAKKPKPPALAALTQTPIQPVVAKPATPAAPMDLFVVQEDYAPSPAEEQYAPQAQQPIPMARNFNSYAPAPVDQYAYTAPAPQEQQQAMAAAKNFESAMAASGLNQMPLGY